MTSGQETERVYSKFFKLRSPHGAAEFGALAAAVTFDRKVKGQVHGDRNRVA